MNRRTIARALALVAIPLLAPPAGIDAAPAVDSRIVVASEAGAKLDSDVSKGGGTDDTAIIQGILDRAPWLGALKLVVDEGRIDELPAIDIRSL